MKIKFLLLQLLLFLSILNCNGQDKSKTLSSSKKDEQNHSLSDNFQKLTNLDFDSDKKIIFSTSLNKALGKFIVYYIPISKADADYYQNFDKNNNITPLYDEVNSLNYYSNDDRTKINKILREKIKLEKDFKIIGTYISKNFINIEEDNEYSINFPYSQQFYRKENGKWIYLFDKKIANAEEETFYNSKNSLLSIAGKKDAKKTDIQYSAEGTWMIDCNKGVGNLSISGKEASLILLYNQIYIDMSELKRYDFEKGIAYTLKEIPEDIGEIGRGLNWKEYINNEPIAYIKMIDDNTMYFYWYGFYNNKTKKREFKETNFQQESNTKEIILRKCNN